MTAGTRGEGPAYTRYTERPSVECSRQLFQFCGMSCPVQNTVPTAQESAKSQYSGMRASRTCTQDILRHPISSHSSHTKRRTGRTTTVQEKRVEIASWRIRKNNSGTAVSRKPPVGHSVGHAVLNRPWTSPWINAYFLEQYERSRKTRRSESQI